MDQIELSQKVLKGCIIGGALSMAMPGLLPGVALICIVLLTMDA